MKFRDQYALLFGLLLVLSTPLSAQEDAKLNALRFLSQAPANTSFVSNDLQDLEVTDQYTSKHNGLTHVYVIQRYQGTEIYNAIASVHLKNGEEILFHTNRFYDQLDERISVSSNQVTAAGALVATARALKLPTPNTPQVLSRSNKEVEFMNIEMSRSPIPAKLVYLPMADGSLQLSWNLFVEDPRDASAWNVFVDAQSGTVLRKQDETIYCTFDHSGDDHCKKPHLTAGLAKVGAKRTFGALADGATYNVFPGNIESPIHGDRVMVNDPADPVASPFGWHDTNGREGPEYTITRGNNVHAYLDSDPDDLADEPEPDGGEDLIFDFPYTIGGNPINNSKAAVTQLFYMNNYVHDFVYYFGFDEAAGNYQQNNYGNGGRQGDPVRAEAQDGSGLNNANFLPTRDGTNGRMQMFLWSSGGNSNFIVESPESLVGTYPFTTAAFGPQIIQEIEGNLVNGISASANPNLGCTPLGNAAAVNGNIVLLDRGDCFFEEKVNNAEAAGAIACIICNNTTGLISLGDVDSIPNPGIPSIMMRQTDCARFRSALNSGGISVRIQPPDFLDSGFDNGIIAHEYGHGISTRLTGGPSSPFCLTNNEQMGEGWSDFFTLVTSVQEDGDGTRGRGIGTFVRGQTTEGDGIRRQLYSIDDQVNDQTYDDVIGTGGPHPLGEVWASTLWDIYWALADEYGFNPDPTDATAGNNIAIQLVIDGMKLQACSPGFLDGRDAILAADIINNGGVNECTLWEVFASRGLGWSASQGSNETRNDNIEAFDTRPACIQELKIAKTSTPLIKAGDIFTVNITLTNDKLSSVSEVIVSDVIPAGATFVPGSTNGTNAPTIQGGVLIFEVGNLSSGSSRSFSYQLQSDPTQFSTEIFLDDIESGRSNWNISNISGSDIWMINADNPNSGQNAWFAPNTARANDQSLQLLRSLNLSAVTQPVLRFAHDYSIEPGVEGGIIEVSTNGVTWIPVDETALFRQAFVGRVAQSTFARADQKAFWGDSEGFVSTYIDLATYVTTNFRFRFRYSTDQEVGDNPELTDGWYVDDIEVFDMVNYISEACVSSAQGDNACAMNEEKGTVVESDFTTNTNEAFPEDLQVNIFPNPATNQINVAMQGQSADRITIQLMSLEGRILEQVQIGAGLISENTSLNVSALPKGMYFVKIQSGVAGSKVEKIVIQ